MVFLIFFTGLALRLILFASPKSLWFDEWASVSVSLGSFRQTLISVVQDTHPPFYYSLLHASIRFLGLNEFAFRLPALLAGLGLIFAVYGFAGKLFDKKTARLACGLTSALPFFVHLSQEIRNHGLPVFFSTAATYAFFKIQKSKISIWGLFYILCGSAAVYSDHFSWFWFLAIALFSTGGLKYVWKYQIVLFLCCLPAMALLGYHAWHGHEAFAYEGLEHYSVLTVLKQMLIVYWHFVNGYQFLMYWNSLIPGYFSNPVFWLDLLMFSSAAILSLNELWFLRNKDFKIFLLFIMATFLPTVVVGILNPTRLDTRYFGISALFFVILCCHALTRIKSGWLRNFLISAWILTALTGNFFMDRLPTDPLHREDYLAMTRYVEGKAEAGDAIVLNHNLIFPYYLKKTGLRSKAPLFSELKELSPDKARNIKRIWYLDGLPVSGNDFYLLDSQMKKLGFTRLGSELRFGGTIDYVIVNIFVQKS